MINFLLLFLVFFVTKTPSLFAQNDSSYSFQEKDKYYNDYLGNIDSYQSNDNNSEPSKSYYDKIESNNSRDNFDNSFDYNTQPKPIKKYKNFKDGKGSGYRVYDNSNRQSYFCDIAPAPKKIFTHDNNFSGIYFGVGVAKIDASFNLSETSKYTYSGSSSATKKTDPAPYNFSFSGSQGLPSIIIGQGRLFSSGLFLGQEFAMNIGEFKISSNKIDNSKYKKVSYLFSNYSYYSGKFGYNVYKNFLPYLKVSLSSSDTRFILQNSNEVKKIGVGESFSFGIGGGIDISIEEHIRAIIDYTQFSGEGEISDTILDGSAGQNYLEKKSNFTSKYAFTRVSLIYRF
jgi:hypothetical protein